MSSGVFALYNSGLKNSEIKIAMKNFLSVFGFILITFVAVKTQTPPAPRAMPTQNEQRELLKQEIRRQENLNQRIEQLRNLTLGGYGAARSVSPGLIGSINELYRKPTKKELALLAPADADKHRYAEFLRTANSGLIKLVSDKGCAANAKIIVATADCLALSMPGAGSSYSFRKRNYGIARLADVTFTENSFQATGKHLHGIFVNIGDVPLETINLQTNGLGFLTEFKPEVDFQKAKYLDEQLTAGVKKGGFVYRRALRAVDNTTYVLRSIAYRGTYLRAVSGLTYNELAVDKRFDVTVAFRIVRRHDDGAVTILWKQLARQTSPKTKRGGDEKINTPNPTTP